MKKGALVLGVVLPLLVCFAIGSMACPNKAPIQSESESPYAKKAPGAMAGMMPCMRPQSMMVATSDGGVVVLMGNRLLKYDKNLDLVKEIKIEMEPPRMEEGMPGMPMMMSHDAAPAPAQGSTQDTKK